MTTIVKMIFRIIGFSLGYGSSIIYSIIGYMVLVNENDLGFTQAHSMVFFWSFLGLSYLTAQALQVQNLKGKNELLGIVDILLSLIPGIVVVISFGAEHSNLTELEKEIWNMMWYYYLWVWLFDLAIFGLQILRIFRMTSEISSNWISLVLKSKHFSQAMPGNFFCEKFK